ncbi:T9SS type B sorting domain-containing protein [Ichthyobacterium seriolicida]|uniref:Ig-like domain-containing protein n=1 Tax=Ichthyobacterium seriolicida TaxID=242600 RepID=A0A1J1E305_9FLAO|nr:gliding motility-associated C-terminal domain-containing protein [Ichthyobacterium seriolicida]BAV94412.1 hypothetical protein JBKA6_0399 [Ichthyobacterium seriolicida]
MKQIFRILCLLFFSSLCFIINTSFYYSGKSPSIVTNTSPQIIKFEIVDVGGKVIKKICDIDQGRSDNYSIQITYIGDFSSVRKLIVKSAKLSGGSSTVSSWDIRDDSEDVKEIVIISNAHRGFDKGSTVYKQSINFPELLVGKHKMQIKEVTSSGSEKSGGVTQEYTDIFEIIKNLDQPTIAEGTGITNEKELYVAPNENTTLTSSEKDASFSGEIAYEWYKDDQKIKDNSKSVSVGAGKYEVLHKIVRSKISEIECDSPKSYPVTVKEYSVKIGVDPGNCDIGIKLTANVDKLLTGYTAAYQWTKDGQDISINGKSKEYTITGTDKNDTAQFSVKVRITKTDDNTVVCEKVEPKEPFDFSKPTIEIKTSSKENRLCKPNPFTKNKYSITVSATDLTEAKNELETGVKVGSSDIKNVKWFKDDAEISEKVVPLEVTEPGKYRLELDIGDNHCTALKSQEIEILEPLDLKVSTKLGNNYLCGGSNTLSVSFDGEAFASAKDEDFKWYKIAAPAPAAAAAAPPAAAAAPAAAPAAKPKASSIRTLGVFFGSLFTTAAKIGAGAVVSTVSPSLAKNLGLDKKSLNRDLKNMATYIDATAVGGTLVAAGKTFAPTEIGRYYVTTELLGPEGCVTYSNSIDIVEMPNPTIEPANPEIMCGKPLTLEAKTTVTEEVDYVWEKRNDDGSPNTASREILSSTSSLVVGGDTGNGSGTYMVSIVTKKGCSKEAEVRVTSGRRTFPAITLTSSRIATCAESDILYSKITYATTLRAIAQGHLAGGEYRWYRNKVEIPNENTERLELEEFRSGDYEVSYVDGNCSSDLSNAVEVKPESLEALISATHSGFLCEVEKQITITGNPMIGEGEGTYQWYKDNELIPGATSSTYKTGELGKYHYIFDHKTARCKIKSKYLEVQESDIGVYDPVRYLKRGEYTSFVAYGGKEHFWNTGAKSYSIKTNPVYEDREYIVDITSEYGCKKRVVCKVIVDKGLSNILTNQDNWSIPEEYRKDNITLYIYDRIGRLIYEKRNYDNSWSFEGKNGGTYYYILRITKDGKTTDINGYITVLR